MGLVHLVVDMQEIDVAFVNVVRHDYYDCRGKDGRDLLLLREGGIHVYKLNLCVDSGQKNALRVVKQVPGGRGTRTGERANGRTGAGWGAFSYFSQSSLK